MFGIRKLINRVDDLIERLVRIETKIDGLKSSLSVIGVNARDSFARIEESLDDICETANGIIVGEETVDNENSYTTRQVCDILGIDEKELRRYRREGKVAFTRVGNAYLYSKSSVTEFEEELKK